MPTVLRQDGFRSYFFGHEPNEPPHIHVDRGGASAKFWLEPPSLARSSGYSATEPNRILYLVREHRSRLLEAWNGYFGTKR